MLHIPITKEIINGKEYAMEAELEVIHLRTWGENNNVHESLKASLVARGRDKEGVIKHDDFYYVNLVCDWNTNDKSAEKPWVTKYANRTTSLDEWHKTNFPSLSEGDLDHITNDLDFRRMIIDVFGNNLRFNEDMRTWYGEVNTSGYVLLPNGKKRKLVNAPLEQKKKNLL